MIKKSTRVSGLGLSFFVLCLLACSGNECRTPEGAWATGEGQILQFEKGGRLLWLTRFGSDYDTIQSQYKLDCTCTPMRIDIDKIQSGAFADKQLLGIFEWTGEDAFRVQLEVGSEETDRPTAFDSNLTQKYSRKKE
jgi:hypothetical protein